MEPEKIIKAHCNHCDGERNQRIRAEFAKPGSEDIMSWETKLQIIECCGCDTLSFRKEYWFSEWDQIVDNKFTGEPELEPGIEVTTFPPALARRLPLWFERIDDVVIRDVITEVYASMQHGHRIVAAAGARILVDRATTLAVGDVGGFEAKLTRMVQDKFISASEKELLDAVTDAGSAAAHRGYSPAWRFSRNRSAFLSESDQRSRVVDQEIGA